MRLLILSLAFMAGATLPAPAAPARAHFPLPEDAVVAIGDVHGDLTTLRGLLRSLGLVDSGDRWQGGKRHLVQTGDVLDRGPDSRKALELIMRLEKEAEAAGGRVVMVLGNHEVMNVCGDLRYTTREEFAAFAAEEDPAARAHRKERILGIIRGGSPLLKSGPYRLLARSLDERTFETVFPPGFFAHRLAFSPQGRYGKWLLQRSVVHREGKSVFLHGGLSAAYGGLPAEEINRRVLSEVLRYLEAVSELEKLDVFDAALGLTELDRLIAVETRAGPLHPSLVGPFRTIREVLGGIAFDEDGPLWYRGLALGDERELAATVERALRGQTADRIVIGHSPLHASVESRFAGRVFLIDTGMNQKVYGGHPSALVIPPQGPPAFWQVD